MRTWMVTLIVLLAASLAWAAEPLPDELAGSKIGVYGIGNEYQIGGGFLVRTDEFTSVGIDGRWIDDGLDTWAVSGVVMWTVLPGVEIPLGGLLPQLDLPVPTSIPCNLNIGGRLGYQRSEETEEDAAIVGLIAELEFNAGKDATMAIRYEYQFDSDSFWSELPAEPTQDHATFLVLKMVF